MKMNDAQNSTAVTALASGAALLCAGVLVYEIVAPPSASIIVGLKTKLGEGEGQGADHERAGRTRLEADINSAIAQVNAWQSAYNALYSAHAQIQLKAYNAEIAMYESQKKRLDDTNIMRVVGANAADTYCMLAQYTRDPEAIQHACGGGEAIREQMLGEYPDLLTRHRSDLPETLMQGIPRPEDVMMPEFERIRAQYELTSDAD